MPYFVVVVVGSCDALGAEVVVVVGAALVVLVVVDVDESGPRPLVVVVVSGEARVVVVVVLGDLFGVVLPWSAPPKKDWPDPACPRTTADRGFWATSSMMVRVAMAMTRAATAAPTTGTLMLRQLRW